MDITNSNFKKLLPEIKDVINSASFICVDGEFTGLSNGDSITAFDTPAEYYTKVRTGALDFLFVQFGLSAFCKEAYGKRYTNKSYNFYLFPRQLNRHARDKRFLCQASSLTFLIDHGFDFNKLFKEGIPYMTQKDEDYLRETLAERQKWKEANASTPNNCKIQVPNKFQNTVDEAVKSFKELLDPNCKKEEVKIEKCSAFVRKLIYQAMDEEIKTFKLSIETQNGVLVAKKGKTKEELDKEMKEKRNREEEEIDDAVGFSKIVRELSRSGKLIIGHNMLLDVCHIINSFLDPLPEDYHEFKEMVHTLFPNLVDTKFMCSEKPLNDVVPSSALEHFINTVHKSPEFVLPEFIDGEENCTFSLDMNNQQLHNAAYDAFITGVCFLSSLQYLERDKAGEHQPVNSPDVKKYMNKIFLMKTPDTHIDLGRKNDPQPSRNHVFHLTFPKAWTSENISELFTTYGGVQIWWQSDTTAFVGLHDKTEIERAVQDLIGKNKKKLPANVSIVRYASYASTISASMSSPRPNKRKSGTSSGGDVIQEENKRRKSSLNEQSIETIPEEEEDTEKSDDGTPRNTHCKFHLFPMNQNWN